MSYTKREYRTNLSMQGLIFLDRKELRCTIKDLSTNGIKIELKPVNYFNDVQAFSKVIIIDDIVNFAIPEMYLDGGSSLPLTVILKVVVEVSPSESVIV